MYARQAGLDELETRDIPWQQQHSVLSQSINKGLNEETSPTFDYLAKDASGREMPACEENQIHLPASQNAILRRK